MDEDKEDKMELDAERDDALNKEWASLLEHLSHAWTGGTETSVLKARVKRLADIIKEKRGD